MKLFVLRPLLNRRTSAEAFAATRKSSFRHALLCLGLLLPMAALTAACDGPCQSLAEQICSCEPNQIEQNSCLIRLDQTLDRSVTPAEESTCSEKLDTCTCAALADDDFEACGLAR